VDEFGLAGLLARWGGVGPQPCLVGAEAGGGGPPVAAVGDAALGDPSFGRLGVDAAAQGEVVGGGTGAEHDGAKALVHGGGHAASVP
jgi:hypothetical protein